MMVPTLLLFVVILQIIPSSHHVVHSLAIISTTTSPTQSNNIIRGANKYGISNNSTILGPADAALKVGVKPTKEATKQEWQRAWKLHRFMMKPLHMFDGCRPKDSKLALACLWWKAIAGNDQSSPVHDYSLSYDLLPPVTRWIVSKRLCKFYPRLHHANVEIRTAYLDKALTNIINTIMNDYNNATISATTQTQQTRKKKKKIRLVVMGGGYDTRSIKLLEHSLLRRNNEDDNATTTPQYNLLRKRHNQSRRVRRTRWYNRLLQRNNNINRQNNINCDDDTSLLQQHHPTTTGGSNAFFNITSTNYNLEAYELDLPDVVTAKRKLLSSRLFRRRPWLVQSRKKVMTMGDEEDVVEEYPKLVEANFNDLNATRNILEGILLVSNENNNQHDDDDDDVTNIILFEGVMIYLNEGIPHALLELCSDVLRKSRQEQHGGSAASTATTKTTNLGYLCFADRLENIPGGDEDAAIVEMERTGWELMDFLSKPGLARHMGVARVVE